MGLILGAVAGAVPIASLADKRRKRMRLFSEQLPDALDLVAPRCRPVTVSVPR
jgi:Flp pilus assembly protein TadB